MGFFSSLASSFAEGWRSGQQSQQGGQPPNRSLCNVPHTLDLMYPALLPRFEELAASGHDDPRAVLYTILRIDPHRKRPFPAEELNALDFGNGKTGCRTACDILLEKGLICRLDHGRALAELYTVNELKALLRKLDLPVSGNKPALVERLVSNGFKISGRNRYKLLALTADGIQKIEESRSDEKRAFFQAVDALKAGDYSGAITAYRSFDDKWGFVHTSGKEHTIFAHYDVPFSQFDFIARYPMRELNNTDDFKATLRACLIAGLMGKGCPYYVGEVFQDEPIRCSNVVDLYKYGRFDDGVNPAVIAAMQENVESDNAYVLQYYISRVMYLSRQAQK